MLKLHILNTSGLLDKYSAGIAQSFDKAIRLAKNDLSLENCDVVVRDLPEFAIPELMVGGFTTHDGYSVYMSLDSRKGFKMDEIYRQLLHELHHAKRFQDNLYPQNLIDNLVTEGLACCYEFEVTGTPPIYSQVTITEEQKELAKKHYFSKDYDHNLWFFGANQEEVPKWFGYSYGYLLCKDYLSKNSSSAPKAVSIRSEEIIS
jgi:uncharacterized protein YjaZ